MAERRKHYRGLVALPVDILTEISSFCSENMVTIYWYANIFGNFGPLQHFLTFVFAFHSIALSSKDALKVIWHSLRHIKVTTRQFSRLIPGKVPFSRVLSLKLRCQPDAKEILNLSRYSDSYGKLLTMLPKATSLVRLSVKPHGVALQDEFSITQFFYLLDLVQGPLHRLTWIGPPSRTQGQNFEHLKMVQFRRSLRHLKVDVPWVPNHEPLMMHLGEIFPKLSTLALPGARGLRVDNVNYLLIKSPGLAEVKLSHSTGLFASWYPIGVRDRVDITTRRNLLSNQYWAMRKLRFAVASDYGSIFEMASLYHPTKTIDFSYVQKALQFENGTHSTVAGYLLGPEHGRKLAEKIDSKDVIYLLKNLHPQSVNLQATTERKVVLFGDLKTGRLLKCRVNPVQAAIVCHKPVVLKLVLELATERFDLRQLAGGSANLFHLAIIFSQSDCSLLYAFKFILKRKDEFGVLPNQIGEEDAMGYTPFEACLREGRFESAHFLRQTKLELEPKLCRSQLSPASLLHAAFNRNFPISLSPPISDLLISDICSWSSIPESDLVLNDQCYSLLSRVAVSGPHELFARLLVLASRKQIDICLFDLVRHGAAFGPTAELLLDRGASPAASFARLKQPSSLSTAFLLSCSRGATEFVAEFLKRAPELASIPNAHGSFPAQVAVESAEFLRRQPDLLVTLVDNEAYQTNLRKSNHGEVLFNFWLDRFYSSQSETPEARANVLKTRRAIKKLKKLKYRHPQAPQPEDR